MYIRILFKSVLLILSFFAKGSFCEEVRLKNSLFHQTIQSSNITGLGIMVSYKDSSEIDYSLNGEKFLIPASLSKIVTASALYDYFAPFHRFETLFLANQPLTKEGVFKGNLYLKGGGDPSFVSETMWNLVNHLKRTGIQQVQGDLIVDESLFPAQKSRKMFSLDRSYNSPLSALSFNWNSINIYIRPGLENQKANIRVEPQTSYLHVDNRTSTQKGRKSVRFSRKSSRNGRDVLYIKGRVPIHSSEFVAYRNISNPALFTGYNAIEFLKQAGIQIFGEVKKGEAPKGSEVVARVQGQTVFQIVQGMMKYSNNFIANMMTIQLSLLHSKKASVDEGLVWIRKFLDQKGFKGYQFVEPAGLSRRNKMTPQQIFQVLVDDLKSPYSYEKLASYPLANGEGTLRKRFKKAKPFSVRAKTGRLSGVDGLAGYVTNQKGERRVFVFIYNGNPRKQMQARHLFDRLVEILIQDEL